MIGEVGGGGMGWRLRIFGQLKPQFSLRKTLSAQRPSNDKRSAENEWNEIQLVVK